MSRSLSQASSAYSKSSGSESGQSLLGPAEVLTIYDGSSSQKYSDTFEKYSGLNEVYKETDETPLSSPDSIFNLPISGEKDAIKFIETYFYKFILRIQDNEVFSTRVTIYETIVYALSFKEAMSKGIKIFIEKNKIFKFYGKELETLFMSLKTNEQNIFDENCNIEFLCNKIVYLSTEKIQLNKILILEEGHKE